MGSQPKTIVGNGIFIYILVRIFHYWLAISFPRWFIGQLELTISLEKASPILRGGSEVRDQSELEEDLTNFFRWLYIYIRYVLDPGMSLAGFH